MKIVMEKMKVKWIGTECNDLQVIEPPWVYKPLLYFLPVLWSVAISWSSIMIRAGKPKVLTLHATIMSYIKVFLAIVLEWSGCR